LSALFALLLPACARTWTVTYDGNRGDVDRTMVQATVTPDGSDRYLIESSGVQVHAAAPRTNTGGNHRAVFWPEASPPVTDGQSCATWTAQSDPRRVQQGAALRIATDEAGRTRAVTVTKNIWFGITWTFNFHVWDTSRHPPGAQIGNVDMGAVVGGQPLPWHLCARTVGRTLEMKVWTGTEPEPRWGDRSHGGAVTLPDEWVYPGKAGWYIGHLAPGGFADFSNLRTWRRA
jgi:hypothetical protein